MHLKRMICVGAAVFGATATTGVATASAAVITEAGSTLVQPLVSTWSGAYTGATIQAGGGGSASGIKNALGGTVDIGASDAPMLSQAAGNVVQIPWAASATGIGYNIPGVGVGLKLSPATLAKIFTGKITTWGNSAITGPNKNYARALRAAGKITPVFRSDGSGDSYAFENFLRTAANSNWGLGVGTSWPGTAGVGENGNAGVAAQVKTTRGAIGYISGFYLLLRHITPAAVENQAGKYILPNPTNIAAAVASRTSVPGQGSGFDMSIVYPSRRYKAAYPISTYTYALVNTGGSNIGAVKDFLNWVISPQGGQRYGIAEDFSVPLPASVRSADAGLINGL